VTVSITSTSPKRTRLAHSANPHRLYRTGRLANLFGVHPCTIWRWKLNGTLPKPIRIGSIEAWTEQQVQQITSAGE